MTADEHSAVWRERLVGSYGLPADTRVEPRRPGRHVVRTVRAGGQRFLLKAVPAGTGTAARLRWELDFQRHLASLDGPAPRPIERRDHPGEMQVAHPAEGLGALYEYLPGRICEATQSDAQATGRALAELHLAADGYAGAGSAMLGDRDYLLERPLRAIRGLLGPRMSGRIEILAERLGGWLDRLPREAGAFGLCHGDCHHENAFIDDAGRVRYVDFEHTVRTWRAFDLATFIWGTFRLERGAPVWHRFMQEYSSLRQPSEAEASWIRPFLVIRQIWWLGFNIEASASGTGALGQLVDEGLAFALALAEDIDVGAVVGTDGAAP